MIEKTEPEVSPILDLSTVASQATLIAVEAIASYSMNTDQFIVLDLRSDGTGNVRILLKEDGTLSPFQTMSFKEGVLVAVVSQSGNNSYEYTSEGSDNPAINFSLRAVHFLGTQYHTLDGCLEPNKQQLSEVSRIGGITDLQARYNLTNQTNDPFFELRSLSLPDALPLPPDEKNSLLPKGKTISLEEVLSLAISPNAPGERAAAIVPGIQNTSGFPEFVHASAGSHGRCFVNDLNFPFADLVRGYAYPLKKDPNGWLALVRLNNSSENESRALSVTIDRESIQVKDVDNMPHIQVNVTINSVIYNLDIPVDGGSWKNYGTKSLWVPINSAELRQSIENGYYFDLIVSAAVTKYYGEHYS